MRQSHKVELHPVAHVHPKIGIVSAQSIHLVHHLRLLSALATKHQRKENELH